MLLVTFFNFKRPHVTEKHSKQVLEYSITHSEDLPIL